MKMTMSDSALAGAAPELSDTDLTTATDGGSVFVQIVPPEGGVPFNQYTAIKVRVFEDRERTRPVEYAKIKIDAGMPHGQSEGIAHGMNTKPQITSSGRELHGRRPAISHARPVGAERGRDPGKQDRARDLRSYLLRGMNASGKPSDRNNGARGVGLASTGSLLYGAPDSRSSKLHQAETVRFDADEREAIRRLSPLQPPPPNPTNAVANDPQAARLGQSLFFDKRLSGNGQVACASCHQPAQGFTDGLKIAEGIGTGRRHTPSLLNTVYNRWFFWDGRADSLWAQAVQPLETPVEMGTNRLRLAHLVHDDPALRRVYEAVFGSLPALDDLSRFPPDARPVADDPKHPHNQAWQAMRAADRDAVNRVISNVAKAIAAYERRLVRGRAPVDQFVAGLRAGDPDGQQALSTAAKRGLRLFVGRANCTECHSGPNFTDNEFHNLGLAQSIDVEPDRGRATGIPLLRADPFNTTGSYSDAPQSAPTRKLRFLADPGPKQEGRFKTPSLRNIAVSPPYMHDGRFATLTEVVRFYSTLEDSHPKAADSTRRDRRVGQREGTLQRLELSEQEIADMVAFLRSLTGERLDGSLTEPPSGP